MCARERKRERARDIERHRGRDKLRERERDTESEREGESELHCLANLEQISKSRPDSGLGVSHFHYESLSNHSSCPIPVRQRLAETKNNFFKEMCSGSKEGLYLRLIDFCITQL